MNNILNKAIAGTQLTKNEAVQLLNTSNFDPDLYKIFAIANDLSRKEYGAGYVFAQIGLNAQPCSKNCAFCSMAENHYVMETQWQQSISDVITDVSALLKDTVNDIFLMTTADYPFSEYLKIAESTAKLIPKGTRLVANIGDFDSLGAKALKSRGFTGAYHIHRLREGVDTGIHPDVRIKTLDAIIEAGLELYYCVEPIGPEHSYEEIADEMIRARDYGVSVMAVMRRIPVPGTPLYTKGQITALELSKIAAVTRLVSMPARAMNAHEITPSTLLCGVNQLYAEYGANPRDDNSHTEGSRGYSVREVTALLSDFDYIVKKPSAF